MSYQAECTNCEETYITDDPNEIIGKCGYCDEWLEAEEICTLCKTDVNLCECQRCLLCGTLYEVENAETKLNDDSECKECAEEESE